MYGRIMEFKVGEVSIRLRPFANEDEYLPLSEIFSSHKVMRFMDLPFSVKSDEQLKSDHKDNYESKESIMWAIEDIDNSKIIGYTLFWGYNPLDRTSASATALHKDYWGKKIASHVNLARTYYGYKILNLISTRSYVISDNLASIRALQNIGFANYGTLWSHHYVEGEYKDSSHLVWYNPYQLEILFPNGIPDVLQPSVSKAKEALEKAKDIVSFP